MNSPTPRAGAHPSFGRAARRAPESGASVKSPDKAPARWVHVLNDGSSVLVRPIRKEDEALERAFIRDLSPESRWFRFMGTIGEPSDAMIRKFVNPDDTRDCALIALAPVNDVAHQVGVARYSLLPDGGTCECAIAVADAWQKKGLAVVLMRQLIEIARERGIRTMIALQASDNQTMHQLAEFLGFVSVPNPDDPTVIKHELAL